MLHVIKDGFSATSNKRTVGRKPKYKDLSKTAFIEATCPQRNVLMLNMVLVNQTVSNQSECLEFKVVHKNHLYDRVLRVDEIYLLLARQKSTVVLSSSASLK